MTAGHRVNTSPGQLGDLDPHRGHAPGGPRHQDGLPGLESSSVHESVPRRDGREGRGRRRLEGYGVRDFDQVVHWSQTKLRETTLRVFSKDTEGH